MSALSGAHGQTIAARPVTGARLHGGMLWLTGLAGAFVLVEPSPYEVIALATAILYSVTGLSLRPAYVNERFEPELLAPEAWSAWLAAAESLSRPLGTRLVPDGLGILVQAPLESEGRSRG